MTDGRTDRPAEILQSLTRVSYAHGHDSTKTFDRNFVGGLYLAVILTDNSHTAGDAKLAQKAHLMPCASARAV